MVLSWKPLTMQGDLHTYTKFGLPRKSHYNDHSTYTRTCTDAGTVGYTYICMHGAPMVL